MGQSVAIVGNIEELGNWKQFKANMKWTDGHVWVLENVPISVPYFQYKYVIMRDGQPEKWEQGINRIGDLMLLSAQCKGGSSLSLNDQFDRYTVNFSMHYPVEDGEYMRINGDTDQLGFWQKGKGAMTMERAKQDVVWLTGEKVRPWQFPVTYKQGECPGKITYKYLVRNDKRDTNVWEREPSRKLDLQDPNNYQGELGKAGSDVWRNVEKAFIVNGHVEMSDANFVGGLTFDKIGNTNIFIGPYPQLEKDTQAMKEAGITGVFNVQT